MRNRRVARLPDATFFRLWATVLTDPKRVFAQQKGKASWGEAAKHLVVSSLIAGAIAVVFAAVSVGAISDLFIMGLLALVVVGATLILLVGWLIFSAILLMFAKLLGGKGSLMTHAYLIALCLAPLNVLSTLLGLIPIAGGLLNALLGLYGLYLLTLALMTAHRFSLGRAVLTWAMPVLLVLILAVVAGLALFVAILTAIARSLAA